MAISLLKLGSRKCTINSFRELWLERTSYLHIVSRKDTTRDICFKLHNFELNPPLSVIKGGISLT